MEVGSLCQRQIGPRGREQGVSSKTNGILKRKINVSFQNGWGMILFLVFGRQMGHYYYFIALIFYFL